MIGDPRPRASVVDVRFRHPESTHIDAVERHEGPCRGECARRPASHELEYLVEVERICELVRGALAPVVEVSGHDQRRLPRHQALDALAQPFHLAAALAAAETEMHAYAMQHFAKSRWPDL